jgi:hypothetical protein
MSITEKSPVKTEAIPQAVSKDTSKRNLATWNDIGDGFETFGKIGLALAIGMSAAGLFCRLAEQGKVRVPTLSGLVLNRGDQPKTQGHKTRATPG